MCVVCSSMCLKYTCNGFSPNRNINMQCCSLSKTPIFHVSHYLIHMCSYGKLIYRSMCLMCPHSVHTRTFHLRVMSPANHNIGWQVTSMIGIFKGLIILCLFLSFEHMPVFFSKESCIWQSLDNVRELMLSMPLVHICTNNWNLRHWEG